MNIDTLTRLLSEDDLVDFCLRLDNLINNEDNLKAALYANSISTYSGIWVPFLNEVHVSHLPRLRAELDTIMETL